MPISHVATANDPATTAAITSIVQNTPAGTQASDLLVWTVSGNVATLPATPSGWTLLRVGSTTTNLALVTWYKWAVASEAASYSATVASGRWASHMTALRGVDTTTPVDVAAPTHILGTTAITYPAITPITAGAWILAVGATTVAWVTGQTIDTTWTTTNLDAIVGDANSATATTGNNVFQSLGYEVWTSGAFTPNLTHPLTKVRTIGTSTALRPAAGPTTHPAAGTAAGTSDTSASTALHAIATGTIAATLALTGTASVLLPSSGAVVATSSTSGAADVITPSVQHPAAGTIAATSTTPGAAAVRRVAAGATAGISSTFGATSLRAATSGTVAAIVSTMGTTTLRVATAGSVASTAGAAGTASRQTLAAGTTSATSGGAGQAATLTRAQGFVTVVSSSDGAAIHLSSETLMADNLSSHAPLPTFVSTKPPPAHISDAVPAARTSRAAPPAHTVRRAP